MPEDEQDVPLQMGFGGTYGNPEPHGKHKHEFHAFDGAAPYFKQQDAKVGYLTLFCFCGETKELIVEDRR
jgi:hypothetical protein